MTEKFSLLLEGEFAFLPLLLLPPLGLLLLPQLVLEPALLPGLRYLK